jgi:glycerophosphoryl diester phosphodiesterase
MHPFWELLDQEWIDKAKNLNIGVNAYTVNSPDAYQLALDLNIDGIFSDYPDRWL